MTVVLSDTFAGSGSVEGRTPDVTFASQNWSTFFPGDAGTATISGGSLQVSQPTHPIDGYGEIKVGDSMSTAYGLPATFSISFTVTARSGILYADGLSGAHLIGFWVRYGGETGEAYFTVYGTNEAPEWRTDINYAFHSITGGTTAVVGDGTYPGTFSYDGATITLSMFGQTFTEAMTLSGTATANGISQITIMLGDGCSLSEVVADLGITVTALMSAALTAPAPVLFAESPNACLLDLAAPACTLTSTAHNSTGEQAAYLVAPTPTLFISTGANAAATDPMGTLSAAGVVTIMVTAGLSAPSGLVEATGVVAAKTTAALSAPIATLIGYSGAVCSVSTSGSPKVTASSTLGSTVSAAVTCPLFELTSTATMQSHGGAELLAPSPKLGAQAQAWIAAPTAKLTAIGSATVVATYEAYALNLKHMPRRDGTEPIDEVTHYTNFPFTHIVRYKNSYFGANSTGLYLLEGTTDDGVAIDWAVSTHLTDLGYPERKTVVSAYFGGRLGAAETVTLTVGEKGDETYAYTTPRGTAAQNYRQRFGRGIKTRYFGLGLSGAQDFALDTVDLEVDKLTRRI